MPPLTTTKSWQKLDKLPGIHFIKLSKSDPNNYACFLDLSLIKKAMMDFTNFLYKNIRQNQDKYHFFLYFLYIFPSLHIHSLPANLLCLHLTSSSKLSWPLSILNKFISNKFSFFPLTSIGWKSGRSKTYGGYKDDSWSLLGDTKMIQQSLK